jgi:hypothetical protein
LHISNLKVQNAVCYKLVGQKFLDRKSKLSIGAHNICHKDNEFHRLVLLATEVGTNLRGNVGGGVVLDKGQG